MSDHHTASGCGIGSATGSGSGSDSGSGTSHGTGNTATITDVGVGECIASSGRQVTVSYSNGTSGSATLSLSCDAAGITPAPLTVGVGTGTQAFTVSHSGSGLGHNLEAKLTQGGVLLAGGAITVNVGNPCPVSVIGAETVAGLVGLKPNADLSGTFDAAKGNGIILLVEDPAKIVGGILQQGVLQFADPAAVAVNGNQGTWSHAAIPGARKGQYLRVVLTKDGAVKAIIRAVFE
jgi:hypothetical protein